uniref:Pentacotripeptide-repeat region of PRORP domain-containing protein n=1 Tax=Tetraselmis sp. GSL018 TaxID=582737 RepID=A0A061SD09_9CHLO|mmetsp:Transcript_21139/g.50481  ORF Transcript_21139/g.50481 Transcript_21139/m.50481 type:complete len:229 (-) Transcript_21139:78-764(-)
MFSPRTFQKLNSSRKQVFAPSLQSTSRKCDVQRCHRNRLAIRGSISGAAQDEVAAAERERNVRQEVTRRVKSLGEANKPKEAIQELAQMARMGVQPDTMAATALVHACARNGKMEMAQSVFDELFGSVLEPDTVSFAVLVRGYGAEDPPRWGTIAGILNRMVQDYSLPLTSEIYNAMLDICARTNDVERGIEIMDRMKLEGVDADDFTLQMVTRRKALRSHCKKTFGV